MPPLPADDPTPPGSTRRPGLIELIRSDYRVLYRGRTPGGPRGVLLAVLRWFWNPSIRATTTLRLANASPYWMAGFWRWRLVSAYSIDWGHRTEIGPGLWLPHPVGIVMAAGVRIGSNVMIQHNVTLGGDGRHRTADVRDDAEIFVGAVVIGAVVGEGAVIGANSFVNRDVAPRTVVKRDVWEPLRPREPVAH